MRWAIWLAVLLSFLAPGPLLDRIGWGYADTGTGGLLTKIHPATYLFTLIVAGGLLLSPACRRAATRVPLLLYLAAIVFALYTAVKRTRLDPGGGEMSLLVVTFVTPYLAVIALAMCKPRQLRGMGVFVRLFMVADSLMALAERVLGHRFLPSVLDTFPHETRSAALTGHPLNGAMLTGMMIVYLATARSTIGEFTARLPEIMIHGMAMFAFGGRSALIGVGVWVVLASVFVFRAQAEKPVNAVQRSLPIWIGGAGLLLLMAPLDFVQSTLDRFSSAKGASSSEARFAAIDLMHSLSQHEFLYGVGNSRRSEILLFFNIPLGVEISWLALIFAFGAICAISLVLGVVLLLGTLAMPRDRSAWCMSLFFIQVTTTSLSIGSKSLLLCDAVIMLFTLCAVKVAPAVDTETATAPAEAEAGPVIGAPGRAGASLAAG